jgi:hypothetical protein
MYGVRDSEPAAIAELKKVNFEQDLWGTFKVYTVSKHVAGAKQNVCVEEISNAQFKVSK